MRIVTIENILLLYRGTVYIWDEYFQYHPATPPSSLPLGVRIFKLINKVAAFISPTQPIRNPFYGILLVAAYAILYHPDYSIGSNCMLRKVEDS